jgi:YebC/PmpR family DNA-binding regulatory protein
MAGHSKWKNIRHRKGVQDAKRGKIFTKYIREITVAARTGGGDVNSNPRLRTVIQKALGENMTRDVIDRAIKRGLGAEDGSQLEEIRYEGYGPGGVAVMVDCMTDNRNRTVGEVRHAFTKCGGNLGSDGSVAYLFKHQGIISFAAGCDESKILEVALEAGAEDVMNHADGSLDVISKPEDFNAVQEALQKAGLNPEHAEVTMSATLEANIEDVETAEKVIKLIEMLEDLDDVQHVYTSANIPEHIAEQCE